ncbi:hypothetical protein [Reinekea marinisedimentorum]|uniref:ABC-type amino acid transport substrate-binding protein n=1 Tax=Reinekea marinisedimentorum TaxID=230495 RepID=A0A4R3IAK5_9GAMM|nr:hypothetical protein [Reinekea marinisedimentorum]TCS43340.1 hypothetical protein BCF53_102367 [Reinekea marinisedimentorum]
MALLGRLNKTLFALMGLSLVYSLVLAEPAFKSQPFVMQCGPAKGTPLARWMALVYGEAFRRLNIPLQIYYLPTLRSSFMAESGLIDGQMYRVYEYGHQFHNQLRVDEPVISIPTAAFVRKDESYSYFGDWSSLAGGDLVVEYVRGIELNQRRLSNLIAPENLSSVSYSRDGLINLKFRNSDVFVHDMIDMYYYLQQDAFRDHIAFAGVLETVNLYPYVHRRHSWLAPQLQDVIVQIKQEGLLREYCLQAFGEGSQPICELAQPHGQD